MKKLLMIIFIFLISVVSVLGATSQTQTIDEECQAFGYDYGIAKWTWNTDSFNKTQGSDGVIVEGTQSQITWVSANEVAGVITHEECFNQVTAGGLRGLVDVHDDAYGIQHVTFCADNSDDTSQTDGDVPEFGTITAILILIIAGLYITKRSKK